MKPARWCHECFEAALLPGFETHTRDLNTHHRNRRNKKIKTIILVAVQPRSTMLKKRRHNICFLWFVVPLDLFSFQNSFCQLHTCRNPHQVWWEWNPNLRNLRTNLNISAFCRNNKAKSRFRVSKQGNWRFHYRRGVNGNANNPPTFNCASRAGRNFFKLIPVWHPGSPRSLEGGIQPGIPSELLRTPFQLLHVCSAQTDRRTVFIQQDTDKRSPTGKI